MNLTDEQKQEIQARIDMLEAEKDRTEAKIEELETLLYSSWTPIELEAGSWLPAPIKEAVLPVGGVEPRNGHRSTNEESIVYGLNRHHRYSTKDVVHIWGGDIPAWRKKMDRARKSGALKYEIEGRGFYYSGEALIKWRKSLEK